MKSCAVSVDEGRRMVTKRRKGRADINLAETRIVTEDLQDLIGCDRSLPIILDIDQGFLDTRASGAVL